MKKRKKPDEPIKVIKTSLKSICLKPETMITINNYCYNLNFKNEPKYDSIKELFSKQQMEL